MKHLKTALLGGLVLLLSGCSAVVPANEELVNGDFELALTEGWRMEWNAGGARPLWERSDSLGQPDSGFAARIVLDGQGYGRLRQVVQVENTSYGFGFAARFRLGGSLSCTPIASVILSYQDVDGVSLGSTRWYRPGLYCGWVDSDTCHLVEVPGDTWARHELELASELANHLSGIRAADVARVQMEIRAEVANSG